MFLRLWLIGITMSIMSLLTIVGIIQVTHVWRKRWAVARFKRQRRRLRNKKYLEAYWKSEDAG